LRTVLQTLQEHKLYAEFYICEFWFKELYFLDHVLSKKWIKVDSQETQVVIEWPQPNNTT